MIKFGVKSANLRQTAETLGVLLNAEFVLHESSFRGGDYYRLETDLGLLILQGNYDPLDREAFEANWPVQNLVLYLEGIEDAAWEKNVFSRLVNRPDLLVELTQVSPRVP